MNFMKKAKKNSRQQLFRFILDSLSEDRIPSTTFWNAEAELLFQVRSRKIWARGLVEHEHVVFFSSLPHYRDGLYNDTHTLFNSYFSKNNHVNKSVISHLCLPRNTSATIVCIFKTKIWIGGQMWEHTQALWQNTQRFHLLTVNE